MENEDDKGVLSAYQRLLDSQSNISSSKSILLNSDPRYNTYQLVFNAFVCSPIAKSIRIPFDFIGIPFKDFKTTTGLLLRDSFCRKEVFAMSKAVITHSTLQHVILLYTYERTKVFMSNEKGINVVYGPVSMFANGFFAASLSTFITHLYHISIHTRYRIHPNISLDSLRSFPFDKSNRLSSLYKDAPLSMIRSGLLYGTFFMVYERILKEWDISKVSLSSNIISAYCASYFALTATQPFEVLKHNFIKTDISYWDTLRRFIRQKGIIQLWRGSFSSCIRGSPFFAVLLGSYDGIKRICLYLNGYTITPEYDIPRPGVAQDKPLH